MISPRPQHWGSEDDEDGNDDQIMMLVVFIFKQLGNQLQALVVLFLVL